MDPKYARYLYKKTLRDYSLIAKDFSRTREQIWPELKFLFHKYLIPGDKVLDLGCGNGRYFPLFDERKTHYWGVDNCPQLIEIAKQKHPKAKFQIEDALKTSFPNNFFDKVFTIAVFHQIPSQDLRARFLKETKRILKPGGIVILTVWSFYRKEQWALLLKYTILKILRKSKLDFKDIFVPWQKELQRYYHWFSEKELTSLIKKAGFKIESSGIIKAEKRRNIFVVAEKL
jgi:tRNA (uracil-5-)-methyltransferase TRM9